jgi:hypothetical protein
MSREDRTRRVRAILFDDWDPGGFGPLLPADEYAAYIRTLKPDALATKILKKWEAIVPAPEHETLTKFIREELKSIAAQKGPRLVHG